MKTSNFMVAGIGVVLSATVSSATIYTSNVPLSLPWSLFGWGPSITAYPSTIEVSGAPGAVVDINVTLLGFQHRWPSDMSFLLVSPAGDGVVFYSGVGGGDNSHLNVVDLTFDDEASEYAPTEHWFGPNGHYTFKPTGGTGDEGFDVPEDWPYPASSPPPRPYGVTLSAFDGSTANGSWGLFAYDNVSDDAGSIEGWSIDLISANVPEPAMMFAWTAAGLVALCRKR